jgi:BASS family bile acid:Na+ symporter
LSNIYGGQPTKALVVTSISNIISPIMVPLVVWLFAHTTITMDPVEMGGTIFKLVVIPIVFAIIARYLGLAKYLVKSGPNISVLILLFIIWGIISPIRHIILGDLNQSIGLFFIVILLIMIDFGLGFIIGTDRPEKITWAISASYKNYTLATLIALSLFSPIVALPAIIYTICDNLLLIPLQLIALKKA